MKAFYLRRLGLNKTKAESKNSINGILDTVRRGTSPLVLSSSLPMHSVYKGSSKTEWFLPYLTHVSRSKKILFYKLQHNEHHPRKSVVSGFRVQSKTCR